MAHTSVKISANSSDYQSQMKSAASQMKVLSSEFKLAQTQAKAFGSAADQLKAKAESLTQKITLQKNIVQLNSEQQAKLTQKLSDQKTKQEELKTKVEAAKKAYEDSTKATGANSEQSKALKEELDKLEQEFKANETAIGKTETALANQTTKTNASKASLVEMESELEKVNKELKNHKLNEFASGCDKAGQKMESFGKKMSVVSAGIAAIGAASIAAFKELDEGYDTIVTKTGATGEALEGLTASADNVFGSMPEDMSTVGEAIGEVNTRFHSTGEELESLSTQFIQFSSINGTNVTQSVDQVDKIMKAWNIDTSQTGNLLGLLTSKAQETGISVDKLESYVLDNNSAFKEMGLSLPQAINLMAQFDANGVDSTTALAGLKKALQNATAEGKSMDVALEETIGSIKNAKTDTEALQIATELFGKKGAAEMATAIRENRIDLTSLSSSMSEYGTTVEDTYNGTLDPIDNATIAMNNAKLALSTLATTAQTAAAPVIEKVTTKIQELTKWFTSLDEGQQQTIIKVGLVVAAVGPLAIGFGKVAQGISTTVKTGQQFASFVGGIIAKITAKTAATAAGTAADTAGAAAEAAHTAATATATGVTGGMTVAQTALNAVMNLCPIILIVTLIAGLIAAGIALYKNWDKVKEKLSELWSNVKEKFNAIKETITGAFSNIVNVSGVATGNKTLVVKVTANDGSVLSFERNINIPDLQSRNCLDDPISNEVIGDNILKIRGWALDSSGIKEVRVYIDDKDFGAIEYGVLRADVNRVYPGYSSGDYAGFEGSINLALMSSGSKKLTIKITANNGSVQTIERLFRYKKNKLVVIDPGHENPGGDPGASATHNGITYIESNLNLQIAVRLKAQLEAKGIEVYMTRYEGSGLISTDSTESLRKRVSVANEMNADFFVSIHHNSFTSESANGFEVYYSTGTPITTTIAKSSITEDGRDLTLERSSYRSRSNTEKVQISKSVATQITNGVSSKLNMYNRGAKDSNLYVCKNTLMPSILVENGFLTNPTEAAKVSTASHQQKLAEIIAEKVAAVLQ